MHKNISELQFLGSFGALVFVLVVALWAVLCANHDTSTHEKYGVELWRDCGGLVAVAGICCLCFQGVFKRGLSDTN